MNKIFKDSVLPESCVHTVLPNGLKIYLVEKKDFNSSYAVFGTKYGSIDTKFSRGGKETEVPAGIAHYLEHKLFESEDGDAFTRFSKIGSNANAFTSFDRTCYLFSCSENFYESLEILLDFVQTPYFTAETVAKEQGIIGQEIRMYDDSAPWCVLFSMLENMYEKHPVRIDIAGTVESIAKINADLLYECYNTFYNPANMYVCIAGNFDSAKALEIIEKSIKPCESEKVVRLTSPEREGVLADYVEKQMEVASPLFCFGFKEKCDGERSLFECIASEMLLDVLIGCTSPLYERLIGEGLINDEFETEYFQGFGYAVPMFSGESKNPKRFKELLLEEISRVKREGIDEKLFESVRRAHYGTAIRRYNSVDSIALSLVDCAISDYGPFDDLEILKTIKSSDLQERLNLLLEENSVLSVITPKQTEE